MSNTFSILVLVFLVVIALTIERKKFKREGLMFLRRTEKGLKKIDEIGKKRKTIIEALTDFSIIFSFGIFGYIKIKKELKGRERYLRKLLLSYFVVATILFIIPNFLYDGIFHIINLSPDYRLYALIGFKIATLVFGVSGYAFLSIFLGSIITVINTITGSQAEAPVKLVLPVEVPKSWNAPILSVPIIPWIIAIFVLLVVHEFSHAVAARSQNIRVKSMGYGFLAILPLGFAEPDEKQLEKSPMLKKLRVYSAGSFANFITALVFLGIFLAMSIPSAYLGANYYNTSLKYNGTINGTNAYGLLPDNGEVLKINDAEIKNINELVDVFKELKPGDIINITIKNSGEVKTYELELSEKPNDNKSAFIGVRNVRVSTELKEKYKGTIVSYVLYSINNIIKIIMWIILLNVGIGIANLLPMLPLDGGFMSKELLGDSKKKGLWKGIHYITIIALTIAIFFPLVFRTFS